MRKIAPGTTLPCIVCGIELEQGGGKDTINQPYAGTAFTSSGHYGSTVFDPMISTLKLELNICDNCLVEHKDRVIIYHTETPLPQLTYLTWEPTENEEDVLKIVRELEDE